VAVPQKRRRLSRSAEFDRVYRHGRSASNRHLVLYAFPRERAGQAEGAKEEAGPRLGVSVGRRVGGAVARNRVKRLLREAFWSVATELEGEHDFVIVARADVAPLAEDEGLAGIEAALQELVEKLGLGKDSGDEEGSP
jgi:ribonuclease P protein component